MPLSVSSVLGPFNLFQQLLFLSTVPPLTLHLACYAPCISFFSVHSLLFLYGSCFVWLHSNRMYGLSIVSWAATVLRILRCHSCSFFLWSQLAVRLQKTKVLYSYRSLHNHTTTINISIDEFIKYSFVDSVAEQNVPILSNKTNDMVECCRCTLFAAFKRIGHCGTVFNLWMGGEDTRWPGGKQLNVSPTGLRRTSFFLSSNRMWNCSANYKKKIRKPNDNDIISDVTQHECIIYCQRDRKWNGALHFSGKWLTFSGRYFEGFSFARALFVCICDASWWVGGLRIPITNFKYFSIPFRWINECFQSDAGHAFCVIPIRRGLQGEMISTDFIRKWKMDQTFSNLNKRFLCGKSAETHWKRRRKKNTYVWISAELTWIAFNFFSHPSHPSTNYICNTFISIRIKII